MLILLHVLIALSSLVLTTANAAIPSRRRLHASYALIVATLVSGTYLVISLHAPMLHSCMMGLAYLGVAFTGVLITQYRLAKQPNQDQ